MTDPRKISGLGEVAAFYDGFILDLWGVVHNGIRPLPGAIPALQELKRAKRRVWLLSNAPVRARDIAKHLSGMGIGQDLYDGLHTSGEEAHLALRDTYLEKWGRRCLLLGACHEQGVFEGLGMTFTDDPAAADFVMNGGRYNTLPEARAEDYRETLEACAARNLPMICSNPDRKVHAGDTLIICAGAMAEMYEEMGQKVLWLGKPYRAVYSRVLKDMGVEKALGVGDGMQTDIAGAAGAGLDSALVASGIHRDEAGQEDFFRRHPCRPTYVMRDMGW